MGLKQTNLTKKEEKVFEAIKGFLTEQGVIPTDTDYAMMKYCIANVCAQTLEILRKNSLEIESIGLIESDLTGIFRIRPREIRT